MKKNKAMGKIGEYRAGMFAFLNRCDLNDMNF